MGCVQPSYILPCAGQLDDYRIEDYATSTPSRYSQSNEMSMLESWFGDALERKYTSSITFDGIVFVRENQLIPQAPYYSADEYGVTFPGPAWKSLDLVDLTDVFHVRILRSGTAVAPVSSDSFLH